MTNKTLMILNKNMDKDMNIVQRVSLCVIEMTAGQYNAELEHDFEKNQLALSGHTFLVGPACDLFEILTLIEDYLCQKKIAEVLT